MLTLMLLARDVHAYAAGTNPAEYNQPCDSITVCNAGDDGLTCPEGMHEVASPTRSDVYHIRVGEGEGAVADDPREYVPGQTVTITISVMTKNIRRIQHAGRPSCYCDGDINFVDYGDCGSYACYGGTDMCGGKKGKEKDFEGLPCNTPRYESARYLGLLLYAVDAGEQRVGSWELSTALPVVFWLPPDLACEGKSVMHANARPKALVEHLTFRAPSPGVGPITFRALIKQGATEGGAFYWPVAPAQGALTMHTVPTAGTGAASGDLTLTESTGTTPMQMWFKATQDGENCDDVCTANSMVCDSDELEAVANNPERLRSSTEKWFPSNRQGPAIAGCSAAFPALGDTDERWLFFHRTTESDNTCSAAQIVPPDCGAVPVASDFVLRRLCPCKVMRRRRLVGGHPHKGQRSEKSRKLLSQRARTAGCPKYKPPQEQEPAHEQEHEHEGSEKRSTNRRRLDEQSTTNSATSSQQAANAATAIAVIAFAALTGDRTRVPLSLVAIVALTVFPHYVQSHNWLWGGEHSQRSAARQSMTEPCPARMSPLPHIHVNSGQEFEVGHSTGHPGDIYYTLVRASDIGRLTQTTADIHYNYWAERPAPGSHAAGEAPADWFENDPNDTTTPSKQGEHWWPNRYTTFYGCAYGREGTCRDWHTNKRTQSFRTYGRGKQQRGQGYGYPFALSRKTNPSSTDPNTWGRMRESDPATDPHFIVKGDQLKCYYGGSVHMEDVAGGEKPRRGEDCWQYGCTNRLDCPEPTEDECPDDDCWNGSPATKNISGSNAEKEGRGYGCSWVRQIKDGQYGGPFSYDGYSGCQTADFTNCPYKYEPSGSGNIGIGSTLAQRGSLNWRIAYANTNYPWILQSHRMSKNTRFFDAGGERINRFKIDGPPGEYILHFKWEGYANCIDIAVMPDSVPVPRDGRYATPLSLVPGSSPSSDYGREDHCSWAGGNLPDLGFDELKTQGGSTPFVADASDGTCATDSTKANRLCYIIPPAGSTNSLGETTEQAFDACKARCDGLDHARWCYSAWRIKTPCGRCHGLNVVPLTAPDRVKFKNDADRPIPFGRRDCNRDCYMNEPNGSQVCYPVRMKVESLFAPKKILVPSDTLDEVWYSTCFTKVKPVEFPGLSQNCIEYTSEEFPNGICESSPPASWQMHDRCISCADERMLGSNQTIVPFWKVHPADDCTMCSHIASLSQFIIPTAIPTKAPALPSSTPTIGPTRAPTESPSSAPSGTPTQNPVPTAAVTFTDTPVDAPTETTAAPVVSATDTGTVSGQEAAAAAEAEQQTLLLLLLLGGGAVAALLIIGGIVAVVVTIVLRKKHGQVEHKTGADASASIRGDSDAIEMTQASSGAVVGGAAAVGIGAVAASASGTARLSVQSQLGLADQLEMNFGNGNGRNAKRGLETAASFRHLPSKRPQSVMLSTSNPLAAHAEKVKAAESAREAGRKVSVMPKPPVQVMHL